MNQPRWIILARHQERLDVPNPSRYPKKEYTNLQYQWFSSPRYLQNPLDTPLTPFGEKKARKMATHIIPYLQKQPCVIFSSPFTRCIQTAGTIQQTIFQKTGTLIPIHIEYGFTEPVILSTKVVWNPKQQSFIWSKQDSSETANQRTQSTLDHALSTKVIAERFPQYTFQKNYKSLYHETSSSYQETLLEYANRLKKTLDYCQSKFPHEHLICVGHGHLIRYGTTNCMNMTLPEPYSKTCVTPGGYGMMSVLKKVGNKKRAELSHLFISGNSTIPSKSKKSSSSSSSKSTKIKKELSH